MTKFNIRQNRLTVNVTLLFKVFTAFGDFVLFCFALFLKEHFQQGH